MRINISFLICLFTQFLSATFSKPRVIVIGGSGRVGGSAVRSLSDRFGTSIELSVGGRTPKRWDDYLRRLGRPLSNVRFNEMDFDERTSLESVVRQHDLIIHTAGPFQGLKETTILDSCLQNGKAYLDVCDDVKLSRQSRSEEKRALARKTGAAAVISTGIWPGGSSLFAQEVINKAGGNTQVQEVKFSFFTAGSGNAGPTILTATFLILGEDVLTYVDGKEVFRKSATDVREVDFGEEIGVREVVRLNLIECESCFQSGIPNVETHFGTAPKLWNRLFALMAQVIPQNVLQDRSMMMWFANFSLPMVRLIDTLVGSSNGIRVDVTTVGGRGYSGLLTHRDLEKSVGDAICAFAAQMLKKNVPPGVYFPEEVPGNSFREEILADISADAITYKITETTTASTSR